MGYNVKFTTSAQSDLENIQKYIYENNKDAARDVIAHIINKIETILIQNPGAGRPGRVLSTRELVITKYPYIIHYQVREDCIYILRVMHTSRKWNI